MPARCLLVEDDETQRTIFTRWLTSEGHDVLAVATPEAANEELRKESDGESPRIHIVILDLALGNGRGKFRGLEVLRNIPPAMMCVVLSGYSPSEVQEEVQKANPLLGATFYFQKPLLRQDKPKRDDFADLLHIVVVAGEKR